MLRPIVKFNLVLAALFSFSAHALPIDWHGVFGVDTTLLDSYRRVTKNATTAAGSQAVALANGGKESASFQTYIFRLNPTMIVNDSATIKAEMTSGYARGGRFGDGTQQNSEGNFGNALYLYNVSDDDNNLILNKFYAELYSDTATYVLGRQSFHWGLGAVQNGGDKAWDRHSFTRDGITMKLKLGNFHLSPYYAKLGSNGGLTRATRAREYGASLLYDNFERDLAFGILYSKKSLNSFNNDYQHDIDGTGAVSLGQSNTTLIDLYFRKSFGKLEVAAEVPLLSDELGRVYSATEVTKYKAKAFLLESTYKASNSWSFGLDAGQVSGDDGGRSSFDAMYLNPNYQVANILFRYNLRAVDGTNNVNIYDSYITNATYFKFKTSYQTEKWHWEASAIYAVANETAKKGSKAFKHETNKNFDALADQDKNLGLEFDLDFTYHWNNEVKVAGSFGYLLTGDYYAFANDPAKQNETENAAVLQLRTTIEF